MDEKEDLLQKASELEGKVIELDNIQRNDIEALEHRVECTIVELKMAKEDNNALSAALAKAESALAEADSKFVTYRDKYYSKKTEANVLRDKLEKLNADFGRMKTEGQRINEYVETKKTMVSINENKCKAYRDIKNMFEDYKNEAIRKY